MIEIPEIETARLRLRAFRESDVDAIAVLYADPQAARFIGGAMPRDRVWRAIATTFGHWHWRGFGEWCVERRDTGEAIGWCGPLQSDGWPEAEIAYSLTPAHHGHGFATEAASAALRFVYERLGWTTAISLIDAQNAASQRVAQRLGASLERRGVPVTSFVADIWRHLPPAAFLERAA